MMLLDDRPAAAPTPPAAAAAVRGTRSATGSWRLTLRLARREVLRRPGRTALVAALIATPIFGMTVAIIVARTVSSEAPPPTRPGAAADLVLESNVRFNGPSTSTTALTLPVGTQTADQWTAYGRAVTTTGLVRDIKLVVGDTGNSVVAASYPSRTGRLPRQSGEVWMSRAVADYFDLHLGETVAIREPSATWTLVGIGSDHPLGGNLGETILVTEFDLTLIRPDRLNAITLIDVDGSALDPGLTKLYESLLRQRPGWSLYEVDPQPSTRSVASADVAWGWVIGALALLGVSIIIAAAFATSARRQLATIGLLAANGAPTRVIRRSLALQGFLSGVIGTVAGIGAAVATLPHARGLVERIDDAALAGWDVRAADLAVIAATGLTAATLAALFPARGIARTPVLAALAGRRPLGRTPRWLIPAGIMSFLGGLGLILLVALASRTGSGQSKNNLLAAIAVVGGIGLLIGVCCAAPIAVSAVGAVTSRFSGVWRLSGRSMARTRSRSAAAIAAIATAGAFAVGGATVAANQIPESRFNSGRAPDNAVIVTSRNFVDESSSRLVELDVAVANGVEAILPGAIKSPLRWAAVTGARDPEWAIGDPAVLDVLDLTFEQRTGFTVTGILARQYDLVSVDASGLSGQIRVDGALLPATLIDAEQSLLINGPVIAEAISRRLDLPIVEGGAVYRTQTAVTGAQRDALSNVSYPSTFIVDNAGAAKTNTPDVFTSVNWARPEPWSPTRAEVEAAISAVMLLFVLFIVAMVLSLSAAESRDERDVLVAVGARPTTLSRLAGAKAVVITAGGAILAIPTGFLPIAGVLRISGWKREHLVHFPLLTATLLLVVVPVLAGLVAWGVSAVTRRVRPMRMSLLTRD